MSYESPAPHPLEACVAVVEEALGTVAGMSVEGLEIEALANLLARSQRVVSQTQSLFLKLAAAADRAKAARTRGAASTADLLSHNHGGDRNDAASKVRTAKAIDQTATQAAMDKGLITLTQAEVIAKTMAGLPADLTKEMRESCEEAVIEAAQQLTLKDLRRRADRISDIYAPDRADEIEQGILRDREKAAQAKTQFWMSDQRDGTYKGGFTISELHADMLKTMLDAIAAPRRDHLRPDEFEALADLPYPRRMGLSFTEFIEHMPADRLPVGGSTLTVNFDYDQLAAGVGAATLSTGTRISIDQVRRLACELKIIPFVYSGKSLPLDMGAPQRYFSKQQRIAIENRDKGCTFPGCERPPNWCEVHHGRIPWARGGRTDLKDGVLLCSLHHHVVHNDDWAIRFTADGYPEYLPPKAVDCTQTPRRNRRWMATSVHERWLAGPAPVRSHDMVDA
jgi:hypothetical protein